MKYLNHAIIAIACTLAGCSDKTGAEDNLGPSPVVTTPDTTDAASPASRGNASVVAADQLKIFVSDPRVRNWDGIGLRQSGMLVSNGTNGYLMFGPKIPFRAGKYRANIFGDRLAIAQGNSITFDATSDAGKQVLGKLELDESATSTAGQPLASFEFELPVDVQDLEIRAFVTSGSTLSIRNYEVVPVEAAR